MKQYIKKALWIISLTVSTPSFATTFYYQGSGGTAYTLPAAGAGTPGNWKDISGNSAISSDFTNSANKFDVNGKYCNLAGLTIGAVEFLNSSTSGTPGVTVKSTSKLLEIISSSAPVFSSTTAGGVVSMRQDLDKYSDCTIKYSYSGAGDQTLLSGLLYTNLILEGSNKVISSLYIQGILESSSALQLTISDILYLVSGSSFSISDNDFKFKLMNSTNGSLYGTYFDNENGHILQSYPGTWEFNDNNNVGIINPGTYYNMIISSNCQLENFNEKTNKRKSRGVTTTITNNLNMSANKTLTLREQVLEIKGTLTNTNGNSGGKIIGDNRAEILCNNNTTLYFSQTSTLSKTLNSVKIISLSATTPPTPIIFTLGSDLIIDSMLHMNYGKLSIVNNTLTLEGKINIPSGSSGSLIGSTNSNLICSTDVNTIYFDQSTGEANRTLKNFTVTNGADVTLGNWLNITGGSSNGLITVNASSKCSTNNYLILKADADGYAQVANSAGSIVGNIHVQTYFPSTAGRGYRFISSQVKDGYFYSLRDSGSVASGGSTYGAGKNRTAKVGIQITGSGGSSKGFDVSTTNNPSAFYFNEANAGNYGLGAGTDGGWTSISDVSSTGDKMVSGKGYRVLIRGDRTINLTGTASNNIATTTQITGTYPGSSVQTTITNTGAGKNNNGINLVGNPYPANLSWTAIKNANTGIGLDAAYAVYDVVNGRYNVYNASAGTGTASDDIAAGQGFLVYTSSSSATFTINESCKNTAAKGDRYFKKQRSNHLVITMSYDTLYSDKSIVYFLPGSSTSYDEFDGGHIQNPYVNLSSLDATSSQYALNCLDTLETERTVPLSVKGTAPGDFSMTFEDCGTFLNNDIYLFDKFLNKKVKIDDWTKYDFSITADPFSAEDGRLSLFFTPKETNKSTTIEKTTSFSISPNPVTDNFVINYKGKNNVNVEYSIVNAGGQEVLTGKIQTNDKVITKDLARGIYFMTIKSQTESQTIKFIK